MAGAKVSEKELTLQLSYILIPVGIFAWIAFSLPSIMVNYSYILTAFSDPLGLGWNLFGTADTPFRPFLPDWIPMIQGSILLTGLYLGVTRTYLGLKHLIRNPSARMKALILPSLFALWIVNVLLRLYMG